MHSPSTPSSPSAHGCVVVVVDAVVEDVPGIVVVVELVVEVVVPA